jgi:hypothetical protein
MHALPPGAGALVALAEALPAVPEPLRPFVVLRYDAFLELLHRQAHTVCPGQIEAVQLVNVAWLKLRQTWKHSDEHRLYFQTLVVDPPSFAAYLARMARTYLSYAVQDAYRIRQRHTKLLRKATPPPCNDGTCPVEDEEVEQCLNWLKGQAHTPVEQALLEAQLNRTSISELARHLHMARSRLSECWQSFLSSAREGLQEMLASRSLL